MSGVCSCRRFVGLIIIILTVVLMCKILMPKDSNLNNADGGPFSAINLTESQQTAFVEFKERMKTKILKEKALQFDVFLIMWLQLAVFDVEEAEKLLTENLKWKADENIATIHDEDWSDMKTDFEYNLNEVDNKGRPVLFVNVGGWNIKQAVKSGRKERVLRYITKMIDEAVQLVHAKYEAEEEVTQFWFLLQLEDFGFFRGACLQCLSVFYELSKTFEQKYPKMTYQIVGVNTPSVFSIVFAFIKPILSDYTQDNTHLLGDEDEWGPFMSKLGVKQLGIASEE